MLDTAFRSVPNYDVLTLRLTDGDEFVNTAICIGTIYQLYIEYSSKRLIFVIGSFESSVQLLFKIGAKQSLQTW